jgi:hypothetical protein
MKTILKTILAVSNNERGSALFVAILIVPVLTLISFFAAQQSVQDVNISTNDRFYRDGFYNGDGSVYGTAKLISLVAKHDTRQKVEAGSGKAAPGIKYLNSDTDQAEYFRHLLTSNASESTTEDLAFVQADPANDIGLKSTVDVRKQDFGRTVAGGGAEFGSSAEGLGTQMNVVVFRLSGQGASPCPNTTVQVVGDYWLITNKDGRTKGI